MKKFFNYLCLAAIAATTLVACSKNESVENLPTSPVKKVSFSAKSANPDTKTYFGDKTSAGYPTVWTNTQKVSISLNYASGKGATVTPSADGKTASFDVEFTDDESGNYVFYAISPLAVVSGWSSGRVQVEIPANQTPTMGSVDEKAHIMAAKSATFTEFPENVSLQFSHIAAYGRFMLTNFSEEVTITGIDLTADENIVGRLYFYPEDGTFADNSAGKTVSLNVTEISAESNASKVFWFGIKPVDLQGKNLKVTVHTDGGDYVKTITFPSGKGNFQAGRVASFNINFAGIEPVSDKIYRLVTSYDELTANSEVIIVANDDDYAMSTTQNENNRTAAAITKGTNIVTNPGDAVQTFTLEAGTVSNTVAFKCKNGGFLVEDYYIGAASSSSNWLRTFSTKEDKTSFSVILNSGVAELTANAYTNNQLKYNSSNQIFACYGSGQGDVAIYKLEGSGSDNPLITPELRVITFTQPIVGGSFVVTVDGDEIASGDSVQDGKTITLTATAASGYNFSNWTVNGTIYSENPATFMVAGSDVNISATFELPVTEYTLTFPDDNSANNKVNGYTSTWKAISGGKEWTITNFNNFNWENWSYIRCGSKNGASVATIVVQLPEAIANVELTIDNIKKPQKVTSIKLYVADDSNFTTNVQTFTVLKSTGPQTITIDAPKANSYYKLEFTCEKSDNGNIQVSKIVYNVDLD